MISIRTENDSAETSLTAPPFPSIITGAQESKHSALSKSEAVFVRDDPSSTNPSPVGLSRSQAPSSSQSSSRHEMFFSRLAHMTAETAPGPFKVFFMLAYGVSSVAIMTVVKVVFTQYDFHSFQFVAMLQYLCAALIQLFQRNITGTVPRFPLTHFWNNMFVVLFPLPMLFIANTLSGMGASRDLNMPTFVLMRRISIAMTMVLEWIVLHKRPTGMVVASVGLMILAAMVGTGFQLSGSLSGMIMVHINNILTALLGVVLRKKIDDAAGILTSDGILFYNNAFAFMVAATPILFNMGSERDLILQYEGWSNPMFLMMLLLSSVMGFVLSYATLMCTKLNSPLTTAMVGAAKNTLTSYLGMLFKDYVFDWCNFAGVNIGVMGTIMYSKEQIDRLRESSEPATSAVDGGKVSTDARDR